MAPPPAPSSRRRRLWQLPAQAHELLLAMSFAPDVLRRQAAKTLGRMHRGICILKGSEADVLYSVVHDMGTRNALSEAFQRRLDEAHVLVIKRFAVLRDADALQAAWKSALQQDAVAPALWALLTHPLGAALETKALHDARAWVFMHGRRSVGLARARQQLDTRAREAQLQVADLRARLLAQQQQTERALADARAEIAQLQGALSRRQRQTHVASASAVAPQPRLGPDTVRATKPPKERAAKPAIAEVPREPRAPREAKPAAAASQPITVHGRRVLCVGGIQHAVARYRGRVEKLGGHFEHHDGGVEDSVQALEGRLGRADLVICQAACINHEAYHRIKRHCDRTGTPCMYLDRPSLSRLDRALAATHPNPGQAALR